MSTSKQAILQAIRSQSRPAAELPALDGHWMTYADRSAQFASVLEFVGGRCVFVDDTASIQRELDAMPVYANANQLISQVPGAGQTNVNLHAVVDPHELETVDFAIFSGEFGVAENGAVWVPGDQVRHRAVYFIVQHLALVIRSSQIVDNMHQAYERLAFPDAGYGVFISGPSKTADIEQSLVIGAHGPRSLTVFVIRD